MNYILCSTLLFPISTPRGFDFSNIAGKIFKNKDGVLSIQYDEEDILKSMQWFGAVPQNLYFVSGQDILTGNTYIDTILGSVHKSMGSNPPFDNKYPNHYKKIEATTDSSLGLPAIPLKFVKEYVNQQCKMEFIKIYSHPNFPSLPIMKAYYECEMMMNRTEIEEQEEKTWNREQLEKVLMDFSYETQLGKFGECSTHKHIVSIFMKEHKL